MNSPIELLIAAMTGAVDSKMGGIYFATPAKIQSYDATKQKAVVQPLIQVAHLAEDDTRVVQTLPPITDVPVAFQGAGGYSQTFPITAGDTVLLVFCSQPMGRWLVRGGIVDPADDAKHGTSDVVAIPGLRDFAHALTGVPTNAWCITVPTGKKIQLGSVLAAQSIIKGELFMTAMATLFASVSAAIVAAGAPPSGPPSVASLATAGAAINTAFSVFSAAASTFLSLKAKVE